MKLVLTVFKKTFCYPIALVVRVYNLEWAEKNKQIFYKYSNALNRNISNPIYKVINITNNNTYLYFCVTHMNLCNLIQTAAKSSPTVRLLICRAALTLSDGSFAQPFCRRSYHENQKHILGSDLLLLYYSFILGPR